MPTYRTLPATATSIFKTSPEEFRALVSVQSNTNGNARDFTDTTGTGTGIPIYWLLGAKVANDYDDFYDGEWENRVVRNEHGLPATVVTNPSWVWTGSNQGGGRAVHADDVSSGQNIDSTLGTSNPTVGRLNSVRQEISSGVIQPNTDLYPLYAMSPIINIIAAPDTSLSALALSGNPRIFPTFSSDTTDYDASVPNDVTSITLMPTPKNTNATVTIGATYLDATILPNDPINSGASVTIPLDEGLTVITIVVTATADDDVVYSTTYTVGVTRLDPPLPPPPVRHLFAGSPLAPPRLSIGEQFRLLFVGGISDFTNDNIGHYNGRVIGAAADGHANIRTFADDFRVLISSNEVDARDNTDTRSGDVPIYWLGGDKVADDYDDFYNGSWDSRNARDPLGDLVHGRRADHPDRLARGPASGNRTLASATITTVSASGDWTEVHR